MRLVLVTLGVLLLDLLTKYIVQSRMELFQSVPVIDNIFHITYIMNPGAAFGMMANKTGLFITVTLVLLIGVAVFYKQLRQQGALAVSALGLVVGGALGNLIDRLRYGQVVDFLDFRIWPIFNVADVAIVVGMALLVIVIFRMEESK